jgi:hypothetical protein
MKKLFILYSLIAIGLMASAQSHRFTDTFCFISREAGKKVHKTHSDFQVSISQINFNTLRFQLFRGNDRNAIYDFNYQYDSLERGLYTYRCTNCGRGEISYLMSTTRPTRFAEGDKGSVSIYIQDYKGAYEMTIDLK